MRWDLYIDYCYIWEFEQLKPDLAEKVKQNPGEIFEDEFCYYRMNSKGRPIVHRKPKFMGCKRPWRTPMEKSSKMDPDRITLRTVFKNVEKMATL